MVYDDGLPQVFYAFRLKTWGSESSFIKKLKTFARKRGWKLVMAGGLAKVCAFLPLVGWWSFNRQKATRLSRAYIVKVATRWSLLLEEFLRGTPEAFKELSQPGEERGYVDANVRTSASAA
ncbi:Hypothetical protein NTJ_06358 [Nesidiocoris tenuis]|uniref:Uncharacterized protein n=1 Tax=Nesidiocoris tenuis TaxID=355587 RepID=A0ABN7AMT5_9HEMI|nr:Hypothetical protein NTJ_06358 [Nesidiocoris tenuis]